MYVLAGMLLIGFFCNSATGRKERIDVQKAHYVAIRHALDLSPSL
jgi:hypothetical protein